MPWHKKNTTTQHIRSSDVIQATRYTTKSEHGTAIAASADRFFEFMFCKQQPHEFEQSAWAFHKKKRPPHQPFTFVLRAFINPNSTRAIPRDVVQNCYLFLYSSITSNRTPIVKIFQDREANFKTPTSIFETGQVRWQYLRFQTSENE